VLDGRIGVGGISRASIGAWFQISADARRSPESGGERLLPTGWRDALVGRPVPMPATSSWRDMSGATEQGIGIVLARWGEVTERPVWVVAETHEMGLREEALEVLGEGRKLADQLGECLCCVLLGSDVASSRNPLSRRGVDTVYCVEDPLLATYTTDAYASALTELIRRYQPFVVLMAATPNGHDLAPRVAARLGVGLVTGCVMVDWSSTGQIECVKPIYQGRVYSTVICPDAVPKMATIYPGVIGVAPPGPFREPAVVTFRPNLCEQLLRTSVREVLKGDPRLVDLREAELIVAGGRGAGTVDGWRLLEDLAGALGAAVGGTRVAVDMGCIPRDRMIGQTGKSVRPRLYVGAGVSGISHHSGGVDAQLTIAINTDPNAPIMRSADLGVLGDLHEIIPVLVRRITQIRAERERE